jgi:UDP-N-acetylmuramate dehydrogenase
MEEIANASLARYTTLKIGGEAKRLCNPATVAELLAVMESVRAATEPWYVLGGGSNLLVASSGFSGTVIRTCEMKQISQAEPDVIVAGAGTRLPHLARFAAERGLSGLEFSVGIPGTVGGGVVMNAGAHGSCIANVVESVTVFDTKSWDLVTYSHSDLAFQYRHSAIDPARHIVLEARFRLTPADAEEIKAQTKHNEDYRWQTQPLNWPNAGSTFKNPFPDKGAGLLLDKSGAKQLKEGNAQVSAVHANFVINVGGATSSEVTGLLAKMQDAVYQNFQVLLHPEWKRLGSFSESECKIWNGDG